MIPTLTEKAGWGCCVMNIKVNKVTVGVRRKREIKWRVGFDCKGPVYNLSRRLEPLTPLLETPSPSSLMTTMALLHPLCYQAFTD